MFFFGFSVPSFGFVKVIIIEEPAGSGTPDFTVAEPFCESLGVTVFASGRDF